MAAAEMVQVWFNKRCSLTDASRDQLADALLAHPIVIPRGKAVVARPPEKLLDLL